MASYTFKPNATLSVVNWNSPTSWVGGVVPNSPDADVDFPAVTNVSTGWIYTSVVNITDLTSANSIQLRDPLIISSSLHVTGRIEQFEYGSIDLGGGATMYAGSIANDSSYVQGSGQIFADSFVNSSQVVGGLTINAGTFNNLGTMSTSSGLTLSVTTPPGGFANLSMGTLTGGSYLNSVGNGNSGGLLAIDAGNVISVNAANITLDGGQISSHDPVTGQNILLTDSLREVAASGKLTVMQTYTFGSLNVAGNLTLTGPIQHATGPGYDDPYGQSHANLTSSQLTIEPGGVLHGGGVITAPIVNNGSIVADVTGTLVINGSITGSGSILMAPKELIGSYHGNNSYVWPYLEINGASSQNVIFSSDLGFLQLDKPSQFTGAIAPSGAGDRIVLSNIAASSITGVTYTGDTTSGTLYLQQASGTTSLNFLGNYNAASFALAAGPQALSSDPPSLLVTVQAPLCFVAGTRILTPEGEVAVERLRPGDTVTNWAGGTRRIVWIGTGTSLISDQDWRARPVIVRTGALADGVPRRDLRLTEGHSLYLDGVLMPVASLINGRSILWDEAARLITYYHLELSDHDILVADGAPAESYRDDGNRPLFNRGSGTRATAEMPPYAPVQHEGPLVDGVWQRLALRAGCLDRTLTDDPDLHLIVDGKRVNPLAIDGDLYRFAVAAAAGGIVIASRSVIPATVGLARDHRQLGVAVRRVGLTGPQGNLALDYCSEQLAAGFHEAERSSGFRWTDGAAALPALAGVVRVELEIGCLARYPMANQSSSGQGAASAMNGGQCIPAS